MILNTAGQKVGAQMVSATDGSAFTGSVTVAVTVDAGTQATGSVGSGACTHEGNGYHTYAPAQAETNGALIAFTFTGTGAVPQTVQVYTRAAAPDVNVTQLLGTAWLTPGTAGTPDVNVKLISDDATAADNAELMFDGTGYAGGTARLKVDVDTIKTNPVVNGGTVTFASNTTVASTTGAVGSVTGAVGSVTGAVGSVTGAVGSVTGAVGSVTGSVGGNVTGSVGSIATGGIAAASFAAGAIDAAAIAADAIGASELAAGAVDEILDDTIGDGTITVRQALRILIAGMAGKLSGAATTTVTIRNLADSADVVVATVDASGNRSAVTVTP